MNDKTTIDEKQKIKMKLFNQIIKWEHENKITKEHSDKKMQERIKKEIQNLVLTEE